MANQERIIMLSLPLDEFKQIIRDEMTAVLELKQPTKRKKYFNFKEAIEYLGCAKSTLYRDTSKKRIEFYKRGRALLFTQDQLDDYLQKNIINR